ncbi:hypothetical protein J7904_12645, partial [Vibrio parahaemolyticus]|nr:hypothetical protein [Vibrio parahaemolyticus]
VLSELTLYKTAIVPAKIKDKEFVYLHCYNIIDIEDEVKGVNFDLLSEIPIEERLVFKPSYGAIVVFFS